VNTPSHAAAAQLEADLAFGTVRSECGFDEQSVRDHILKQLQASGRLEFFRRESPATASVSIRHTHRQDRRASAEIGIPEIESWKTVVFENRAGAANQKRVTKCVVIVEVKPRRLPNQTAEFQLENCRRQISLRSRPVQQTTIRFFTRLRDQPGLLLRGDFALSERGFPVPTHRAVAPMPTELHPA